MKKLYRLTTDRKLAGVCAGLGEHFDIDPVIIRLLFMVSVFFGGLGVLAYVVMWILVPLRSDSPAQQSPGRRLHLSSADRKIAGVAGGLGEYFEADPIFFRVGLVILAFGCGIGILLYVLLWLLIPRAPTPGSNVAATA